MKFVCPYCGKKLWALDSVHAMYHQILCREGKYKDVEENKPKRKA